MRCASDPSLSEEGGYVPITLKTFTVKDFLVVLMETFVRAVVRLVEAMDAALVFNESYNSTLLTKAPRVTGFC